MEHHYGSECFSSTIKLCYNLINLCFIMRRIDIQVQLIHISLCWPILKRVVFSVCITTLCWAEEKETVRSTRLHQHSLGLKHRYHFLFIARLKLLHNGKERWQGTWKCYCFLLKDIENGIYTRLACGCLMLCYRENAIRDCCWNMSRCNKMYDFLVRGHSPTAYRGIVSSACQLMPCLFNIIIRLNI